MAAGSAFVLCFDVRMFDTHGMNDMNWMKFVDNPSVLRIMAFVFLGSIICRYLNFGA